MTEQERKMREEVSIPADYQDLGLICMGGMAEVRRVIDRRLNRTMAMKILRTEWCSQHQSFRG